MNDTRRAVLDALDDGPVSGPDLASRLDISRTAVWKHVEALREAGFEIESGGEGYVLRDVPEYGPGIEHAVEGFEVEFHESIPSTNDRARELAAEGAGDVVVLADEQTAGRGRLDREWVGPSGGVWMSVLLRPDLPPAHAPVLTLAAAVATARAADDALVGGGSDSGGDRRDGATVGLKWPNDVLVAVDGEERKLAGILTEMEGETDEVSWVAIGVGTNANVDDDALPAGATSLRAHAGDVDRRRFVRRLLDELGALVTNPDAIVPAWRSRSLTLGRRVRVETAGGVVEGEAVDVEFPGALVVNTDDGRVEGGRSADGRTDDGRTGDGPTDDGRVRVHAGDCEHLRPA